MTLTPEQSLLYQVQQNLASRNWVADRGRTASSRGFTGKQGEYMVWLLVQRGHSCGVTAEKMECQQKPNGMPAQKEEGKVRYKTWCGQIRFSTRTPTGIVLPDKKQDVPVTLEFQISNGYASTQRSSQSNICNLVSFSSNQLEPECQGVSSWLPSHRLACRDAEQGEEWVWRGQTGTPAHQANHSTSLSPSLEGVEELRPLGNNADTQDPFPTLPGIPSGLRKKAEPRLHPSFSCRHFCNEVPRASNSSS